eukprot:GHVR01142725.1.p1 GENE.GHVR01142725.1~~GHVR01142725.1.p1  ORF type:complete len:311 (+),score=34.72 GHVR01142725.1:95-1027(+)
MYINSKDIYDSLSQPLDLLYMEIVFYIMITGFSIQQTWKIRSLLPIQGISGTVPISIDGAMTRIIFGLLLCISCILRTISLIYGCFIVYYDEFNPTWTLYICWTLPAVFFLSAFAVIVMFYAQVHYAVNLVRSSSITHTCLACILISFFLYILILIITLLSNKVDIFYICISVLLSILFTIMSIIFPLYSIRIATQLSSTYNSNNNSKSRKFSLIIRLWLLALLCPLLFALRAVYCAAVALSIVPNETSIVSFDGLVFLMTEGLPSCLALCMFWQRRVPVDASIDSNEHSWIHSNDRVDPNSSLSTPFVA